MEQPSKRAQFVPGMRAYSAHNRLHVNAPTLCRFAQSYIIGSIRFGGSPGYEPRRFLRERIGPSARAARAPLGGAACDAHGERSRFLAARRPCRRRRVAQHRKRELERRRAHGSRPACAHIALTIACMSTPPRHVDLRNLTRSTRSAYQSHDEGATHDQDSTLVAAVDGSAGSPVLRAGWPPG